MERFGGLLKGGGGVGIWRWRCVDTRRGSWRSRRRSGRSLTRLRSSGCCLPGRIMCRRSLRSWRERYGGIDGASPAIGAGGRWGDRGARG